MTNKKDYVLAPGGLNLDYYELLEQYPDDANACYLVALCGRQISVLLTLTTVFLPWYWLWKIEALDTEARQATLEFKNQLEHCLMAGCDVEQLITAINEVRDAIAANSPGDPPDLTSIEASLANQNTILQNTLGITIPQSLTGIQAELDESLTQIDTTNANRNDRLGEINTSLSPLTNLSELSNLDFLSYLENLTHLSRLDTIAGVLAQCCEKTQVPDDLYIPIIFKDAIEQNGHKCRAANLLWQDLYTVTDGLNGENLSTIAETNTQQAIGVTTAVIGKSFPGVVLLGVASALIVLIKKLGDDSFLGTLETKLLNAKSDFIFALYNADTAQDAHINSIATLGTLTTTERIYLNYMFTQKETEKLFIPADLPEPDDPISCIGGSGGIPDDCAVAENSYVGSDDTQWLDGNGNIIMDTWHEFTNLSGDEFFTLDGRYHVQLTLITDAPAGTVYRYVPGDGDCTYTGNYPLTVGATEIMDTVLLQISPQGGGCTYRIRFASEQG